MGRVPGHYCTAEISYPSSPGEGSRFAELAARFGCMAPSLAAALGTTEGCVKLPQPPPLPCKRAENSCKPLENSPLRPWVHPGGSNSPATQAGAPAPGLTQKQHHWLTSCKSPCTTQLSSLQQRISVYFSCGCFFKLVRP